MNLASTSVAVSPSLSGTSLNPDAAAAATNGFSLLFASLEPSSTTSEPVTPELPQTLAALMPIAADGNKLPSAESANGANLPLAVQQQLAQLSPADKAILAKWSALDWQEFMIQLPAKSVTSGLAEPDLYASTPVSSSKTEAQQGLNAELERMSLADQQQGIDLNGPVEMPKLDRHGKGRAQALSQSESPLSSLMALASQPVELLQPPIPVITPANRMDVTLVPEYELQTSADNIRLSGSLGSGFPAKDALSINNEAGNSSLPLDNDSLPVGFPSLAAAKGLVQPAQDSLLTTQRANGLEITKAARAGVSKSQLLDSANEWSSPLALTSLRSNSSALNEPHNAELAKVEPAVVASTPAVTVDVSDLDSLDEPIPAASWITSSPSSKLVMVPNADAPDTAVGAELAQLQAQPRTSISASQPILPAADTLGGSVAHGDNLVLAAATAKRAQPLESRAQVELPVARLSDAARQRLSAMDAKVLARMARLPEAAWQTTTATPVTEAKATNAGAATAVATAIHAPDMLSLMGHWLDNRTKKSVVGAMEQFSLPSQSPMVQGSGEERVSTNMMADLVQAKTNLLVASPDLPVVITPQLALSVKNVTGSWLAEPEQVSLGAESLVASDNSVSLVPSLEPQKLNTTTAVAAPLNPAHELRLDVRQLEWHEKFAEQLQGLRHLQLKDAEIRLDPPELGALKIQLSLQPEGTSLNIHAAVAETRHLIEQSLPKLRELFQQQGLALSQANVSGGGGQGQGQNAQQQAWSEPAGQAWSAWHEAKNDEPELTTPPVGRQTNTRSGGVDHYA